MGLCSIDYGRFERVRSSLAQPGEGHSNRSRSSAVIGEVEQLSWKRGRIARGCHVSEAIASREGP